MIEHSYWLRSKADLESDNIGSVCFDGSVDDCYSRIDFAFSPTYHNINNDKQK